MKLAERKPQHFLWEVAERVGVVRLSRPERKNPLTFESYAELRDLFRDLVYATDVDVVVFASNGGNFCSGGDVHEIIGPLIGLPMKGLYEDDRRSGQGDDFLRQTDHRGGGRCGCGGRGDHRHGFGFAVGDSGNEMRVSVHAGGACGL